MRFAFINSNRYRRGLLPLKTPTIHHQQWEYDVMLSSTQLRPIKIDCDAPAYEVVKASGRAGMRSPQDVPWRRQSPPKNVAATVKALARRVWRLLFAFGQPEVEEMCRCGNTLPERRLVLLRTHSGSEIHYSLAQCGRCRTIHWDKEQISAAPAASRRHYDD